jgi:hypothetical protein
MGEKGKPHPCFIHSWQIAHQFSQGPVNLILLRLSKGLAHNTLYKDEFLRYGWSIHMLGSKMHSREKMSFQETLTRDFRIFFSSNNFPWAHDTHVN